MAFLTKVTLSRNTTIEHYIHSLSLSIYLSLFPGRNPRRKCEKKKRNYNGSVTILHYFTDKLINRFPKLKCCSLLFSEAGRKTAGEIEQSPLSSSGFSCQQEGLCSLGIPVLKFSLGGPFLAWRNKVTLKYDLFSMPNLSLSLSLFLLPSPSPPYRLENGVSEEFFEISLLSIVLFFFQFF